MSIAPQLFYDGAVLAGRSRRGGTLVHCARLNLGPWPGTYSYGAMCGVGNGGLTMLGHWIDEATWRRCPKCVRRFDARFLLEVEHGGDVPVLPITVSPKFSSPLSASSNATNSTDGDARE